VIQTIFNSILRSSYFTRVFDLDNNNFCYLCVSMLMINGSFHFLKTIYDPFLSKSIHFILLSIVIPSILNHICQYRFTFSISRLFLLIRHFSCRYIHHNNSVSGDKMMPKIEIGLYLIISTQILFISFNEESVDLDKEYDKDVLSYSVVADIASYSFWDMSLMILNYFSNDVLGLCSSQFILFYIFLAVSQSLSNVMKFSDAQIFISCYSYYSNLINILILRNVNNPTIQLIYQLFFFSVLEIFKFIFEINLWKEYFLDKFNILTDDIYEEKTIECVVYTTSLLTSTLTICLLYTYKHINSYGENSCIRKKLIYKNDISDNLN